MSIYNKQISEIIKSLQNLFITYDTLETHGFSVKNKWQNDRLQILGKHWFVWNQDGEM